GVLMRFQRLCCTASLAMLSWAMLMAVATICMGAIALTNNPADIQANGIIDWTDIGPNNTLILDPAFTIDISGTPFAARVSEPPVGSDGFFLRAQRPPLENGWSGDFAPGEPVLWNRSDNNGNLGFNFSTPIRAIGFQMEPNLFASSTGFAEFFDTGDESMGIVNFSVDGPQGFANDSATFVGFVSDLTDIAAVLINLNDTGSFVINSPIINAPFNGPTGEMESDPFNPSSATPNTDGGWEFDNVLGTGRWFDPPLTNGYLYETDGLSNFTSVVLPTTVGDSDNMYLVDDGINAPLVVSGGVVHTFPTPVTAFQVTGIDPTVDGGDPLGFPTFLQFDQMFVSFTQTPLSVPEPSSAAIGMLALAFVGAVRRLQ
ncbi:MAG: hypothetical protein ACR2NM_04980, partial [Bythopirellula sp.]